jgi:catechol 2,3-dioxygenase-like lactoylglutathione lyase family enzyme
MATVNHVGLCVTDIDRSRRFYEQVLGFEPVREMQVPDDFTADLLRVPRPVGLTASYLRRDAFVLELLHFDRPDNAPPRDRPFHEPGLTHLSFTVDDLDAARAAVEEHGGEVLADTEVPGAAVMVRDPDGQLLELLAPGVLG